MSFLFKAKLTYEDFVEEAKTYKVPLKFYTYTLDTVTMYMLIPVGSSGIMYMYFCEKKVPKDTFGEMAEEFERLGFIEAESFEVPLP
jgi:hypothetical protein